ncbi:Gfo/Idh/MocA family oxidoreductase [Ornithinimicrobium sp. INDO-MA30-4]|nr:Gfo/Idh/MocA family oxidoreductase [Ornithinimicrobium sp. INDO-MA30-4]UJH70408.1 Gfo/Idh/MocA family oxidoreductase [Ornithinimicrobium sp. INDO-MA30-4]
MAADFEHVPGAILAGVASRSAERSAAFAADFGVEKFYGSYGEIIADPDIDVLYISTPHPQHHAIALAAIAAGKHLLVEKSFTATVAGAEQIVAAARHKGVFVMEAMWTRFQPTMVEVRRRVEAGEIGDVRAVQADLGVDRPYDPQDRLFDPEQGEGQCSTWVCMSSRWLSGSSARLRKLTWWARWLQQASTWRLRSSSTL